MRRKWTYQRKHKGGRPELKADVENLIVRLAKDNLRWGYGKLEGELLKLGFKVSRTTIRNILGRYQIVPAPVRNGSLVGANSFLTIGASSWPTISLRWR